MSANTTAQRPVLRRISRETGLVVAFLFILANSVFAVLMLGEVRQASSLVTHTQNVLVALQEVRELIRQAGAGQRGMRFGEDLRVQRKLGPQTFGVGRVRVAKRDDFRPRIGLEPFRMQSADGAAAQNGNGRRSFFAAHP